MVINSLRFLLSGKIFAIVDVFLGLCCCVRVS